MCADGINMGVITAFLSSPLSKFREAMQTQVAQAELLTEGDSDHVFMCGNRDTRHTWCTRCFIICPEAVAQKIYLSNVSDEVGTHAKCLTYCSKETRLKSLH